MLLLDSATPDEARQAVSWGWIRDITTNPILLRKSPLPPTETLERLAEIVPGIIFYQLTSGDHDAMLAEAQHVSDILGDHAAFKILPTPAGFRTCAVLSHHFPCAITAIYSSGQVMAAEAAGAHYAIIYYHRALTLMPDGEQLFRQASQLLQQSPTQLLAASLKSPGEAIRARLAGFNHLTITLAVLEQMLDHPLSSQTAQDFNQNGIGITPLNSNLI